MGGFFMGNRTEVSLSNQTFGDVTAWRAIRKADGNGNQIGFQESHLQTNSDYQKPHIPVTIFQTEKPKAAQPPTNRITELNGQLSTLWQQKITGEISPKEYKTRQQELARKLHEAERQRGHKPVRTKRE